jgi:hypothetical protein
MTTMIQMREAAMRFQLRHDSFAAGKEQTLRDMIAYVEKNGRFASEKQAEYAAKLVTWSQPRAAAETVAVNGTAISRVRGLFNTAKSRGLKHPKIRLQTAEGEKLVIGEAGPNSRYAGALMLTDGAPFGSNKWYGRIEGSALTPSGQMTDGIKALLTALGDDPARTAEAYGRLTGNCCFCARALTDGRSVAMGYGPVCAEKFGLAWGEERVETEVAVVAEDHRTTAELEADALLAQELAELEE